MNKALVLSSDLTKLLLHNSMQLSPDFEIEFIYCNENEIAQKLINEEYQLALINPLIYSKIIKYKDLRILPSSALGVKGWSNLITLSIKNDTDDICRIQVEQNQLFIREIAKIIMSERFNLEVEFIETKSEPNNFELNNSFLNILPIQNEKITIDLTEDWLDTFDFLLPIAFWVVPAEIEDISLVELTKSLREKAKSGVEEVNESSDSMSYQPRFGNIHWDFDDEFENALDDTLELFYFRNVVPDIVDSKVFGRDYSSGVEIGI